MYVAFGSYSVLPVFPILEWVFQHDVLSFLHSFFTIKAYLTHLHIEKFLLDSAYDAYAVYEYCKWENVTPFIDPDPNIQSEAAALSKLENIKEIWGKKYSYGFSSGENNWEGFGSFFSFPSDIRQIVYSTNISEELSRRYCKVDMTKSVFPSRL